MVADQILQFLFNLQFPLALANGVEVLNPFTLEQTRAIVEAFYNKYYCDTAPRYCMLGINPGRFGGGITGVPFTDPIRMQQVCGIQTSFAPKQELSSVFMYDMIGAYGGAEAFYRNFYITSVSPFGFITNGKNLNYYDDKSLLSTIEPFAVYSLQIQMQWLRNTVAFCLGEGKNFRYFEKLNRKYSFFKAVIGLPHPRFIMQYKLRLKNEYIDLYLEKLNNPGY